MSSATIGQAPVFDVADPAFSITSAEVHEARERSWYATTPYGIAVLRYEQVSRLLKHPKLRQGSVAWPAHNGVTEGPFADWFASWILNKEGEEHHRLRRLMNPAFSPKLIGGLVPRFQALANELIDSFAEPDRCEFVSEFAEPYAARVIAIMLGIPETEWRIIASESVTIGLAMGVTLREDLPKIEAALQRLYDYCDELIADRRANPRDDFVTALVTTMFFWQVPHMDASYLASSGLHLFVRRPELFETFRAHPELHDAFVTELVRYDAPEPVITRATSEDLVIRGVHVPAGSSLRLVLGAANVDPDVFDNPLEFDYTRPPEQSRSLTFSFGSHSCQGKLMAQSQIRIIWERIAARYSRVELASEPVIKNTDASRHYYTLPLRLIP